MLLWFWGEIGCHTHLKHIATYAQNATIKSCKSRITFYRMLTYLLRCNCYCGGGTNQWNYIYLKSLVVPHSFIN